MWGAWAGSLRIKSIPVNSTGWFTPASSENHFVRHILKAQTNFRAVYLVFLFLFSFLLMFLQLMELLHKAISAWRQWRRISRENCRAALSQRRAAPASPAGCQRLGYHQPRAPSGTELLLESSVFNTGISARGRDLRWIPNTNRNFASEHHCWQTWWGQPFISQCVQHIVSLASPGLNGARGIIVWEN